MSETGKSTPMSPRRLMPEVRGRIDAYLLRVDAALTQHGATPHQRRAVGSALRQRMMDKLLSLGEAATIIDADHALAELGPPDSHVADANQYPRQPAPGAMPGMAPALGAPTELVEPEPLKPAGPTRLSLTALIGALWSLLFFAALAVWAANTVPDGEQTPRWRVFIFAVGLSAPIATTVLGLLALGRIQRSRGQLSGLSLALCDALIFPLLLLDCVIVWICWQVALTLVQQGSIDNNDPIYRLIHEIIPTVAVILADYFLVVQAWAALQPKRRRR